MAGLFELIKKLGFATKDLDGLTNKRRLNLPPLPSLGGDNAALETPANLYQPVKKQSVFDAFQTPQTDFQPVAVNDDLPPLRPQAPDFSPNLIPDAPTPQINQTFNVPQIPFGGNVTRPPLPELITKTDEPAQTRPRVADLPPMSNNPRPNLPELPLPSQMTQAKIDEINNKQYGNLRDEKGNLLRDENGKVIHGKNRNEKWSLGEKFLGAALTALQGLATGGAGGALAGLVTGATDRNAIQKFKDRRDLPGLIAKQGQQAEAEKKRADYVNTQKKAEDERRTALINQQNGILDFNRKGLENLRLKNKDLVESIQADDLVTPEEVELAAKEGIRLIPYDRRQFETEARGGTTFERPKLGGGNYSPVKTLPIDEEKVLRDWRGSWQGKDEAPYRLTNKQIADIELAIKQGDVQRAQDIAKYNSSQNFETQKFNANKIFETQKYNATNLNKWNSDTIQRIIDESKTQGTVFAEEAAAKGFASRIESYTTQLNNISADDTSEEATEKRNKLTRAINALQGKLDATLGKSKAAQTVLEAMQQNRPPRPEQISPATVKTPAPLKPATVGRGRQGRTYSRSDIDRVIRQ